MKQEIFSKAEILHHFENLMPRDNKGRAKYVGDSNFLSTCAKQGLIELVGKKIGYRYMKEVITITDINNLINAIKEGYRIQNNKHISKQPNKQSITEKDLDKFIKLVASTDMYKIENGKAYKKTVIWKEL